MFWNVSLLMESALNVYYMAMAVYGWQQWKFGGGEGNTLPVSRWRPLTHVAVIALVLAMTTVSGNLLATNTDAAWPFLDSFTTWASVVTTFMVARKILENWIYSIVIDALSILLYADRGLYLYAALFAAYVVIAVFGYLGWRRSLAEQAAA